MRYRPEMARSRRSSSELDRRVVAGNAGARGRGLFLTGDVDAGTMLVRLGGRIMDETRFREHMATVRPFYALAIDEDRHLVLAGDDPARLGNHSCDPAMWHRDAVTLVARRPLAAGDELTTDYALHTVDPGFRMECACGEPVCRQEVTGSDWRRPELQERYRGRFSPFINDRIAAL